jgi:hypothetical protein
MTLDASSNLGLAETNPAAYGGFVSKYAGIGLHANSTSGAAGLNLYENSTGRFSLRTLNGSAGLSFYDTFNGTERARIDSSGNLLVNMTSTTVGSQYGLRVIPLSGDGTACNVLASSGSQASIYSCWDMYYTAGGGAYKFYVTWNGTINAVSTTISAISDQRLKENIQDLDVGLDKIMALKPRKFDWKAGKGKDIKGDRGWIAQEFEQVFPDMIDTWRDPAPEGEEPYKSVRADLIPVLVKAIQELNAKVEALEAQLKGA